MRATESHNAGRMFLCRTGSRPVYTARQLLDALLMVSGNDAANLLGDMLGGYRAAIARMVTAKAASLGARHTCGDVAVRPGRPGQTLTNWHDLALIYRAALELTRSSLRSCRRPTPDRTATRRSPRRTLLTRYSGDLAGKTGYRTWPATPSSPRPKGTGGGDAVPR